MKLHTLPCTILLFLLLFFYGILSSAQSVRKNDVIIRRDSSRIQALITQMTYEKINYRDLSTADSARKYIYLEQVAKVLLKNGKTVNVRDSVMAVHTPPDTIGQYADLSNLPQDPFEKSIVMANSDQLRDKYRYHHDKAANNRNGAIVFTSFAAASLVAGLVIISTGEDHDDKIFGTSLAVAGPIAGGVLALVTFRNFAIHSSRARKARNELERRNQPLTFMRISPAFDPFNKLARLSVRFSL
ncbi:hypothetical protein [Dyadobacter sandarakinus]|uniref:Uncharacterized protein n=1 Tax=Dyadobacter sandarakinus TaxID=2747268 RepID=A0ABX7IA54_9BACT|nr:hypothetical protein [Dyadobacter sandarakinus]QRR02855.1 hypothetical protein HWI92_19030 [Dyadobacter sandarakinus]